METRQVSSTVIEVLHLKNRSNMMQTTQEILTTAQDERLHTLLHTHEAGQPVLALHIGSQQDPGIRRKYRPNEDSLFVVQGAMPSTSPSRPPTPFVLLVVADGMGGQGHGRTASRFAVQSLVAYMSSSLSTRQSAPESLLALLSAGVQHANRVVYERNQQQQTVMGTTMTAVLLSETTASVAHVGDSRLYLYRAPTGLAQITRDHSAVAALVGAGIIEPDEIYTHPRRNQLYRSLGEKATVEVETATLPLAADDILLVCSDGLWEMVHDQQIAAILTTPMQTPRDTAHALIQAALAGGGADNASAIVAEVSQV
jgi:serine/threonine protein phosphatase PrpC